MIGDRAVLIRPIATAVAIVLTMVAVIIVLGRADLVSPATILNAKVLTSIILRLPLTLELVLVSSIVASIFGYAIARLSIKPARTLVSRATVVLRCVPLLVLALATQFVLYDISVRWSAFFSLSPQIFIMSAVLLALFQFPIVLDYFNNRDRRESTVRSETGAMFRGLAVLFADNISEILSAAMIVELFLGWRGEGRWLGNPFWFGPRDAAPLVTFLLFNAFVVLVIRALVDVVTRRIAAVNSRD